MSTPPVPSGIAFGSAGAISVRFWASAYLTKKSMKAQMAILAGFEWVIQKKGMEAYQKFCDSIEAEIKNADDIHRCEEILNDWGKFFRKGHFYVALNSSSSEDGGSVEAEKVSYSVETVEAQVEQTDDEIVGIWESSPYKIGIVLDTINPKRKYVGFIIESGAPGWTKGDVKLEIFEQDNKLSSNYYMRDHSMEKRDVTLRNETELMLGSMRFINHRASI